LIFRLPKGLIFLIEHTEGEAQLVRLEPLSSTFLRYASRGR
jgi:hypothetical protein